MLISVIIPCYNVEAYISPCLDAILAQSHRPLEIIVVDNNSSDRTVERVQVYQAKHPTLIRCYTEPKQGAPSARNKGLTHAKGQWIQFMDADDLILPDKIAHQVSLIQADMPFIVGLPIWRQLDGSDIIVDFQEDCWKDLFESTLGYTSSNLWNKAFLDQIGGWTESLRNCQDYELMFRLLQVSTNITYTSKQQTIHQDREGGQITASNLAKNWETIVRLRIEIMAYLKGHQASYFTQNQIYFEQMLYRLIRGLANQDIEAASRFYEKYLSDRPVPIWMPACPVPLWNIIALRMFGFRRTEVMRRWLLGLKTAVFSRRGTSNSV